jgi:hypothetical protein
MRGTRRPVSRESAACGSRRRCLNPARGPRLTHLSAVRQCQRDCRAGSPSPAILGDQEPSCSGGRDDDISVWRTDHALPSNAADAELRDDLREGVGTTRPCVAPLTQVLQTALSTVEMPRLQLFTCRT